MRGPETIGTPFPYPHYKQRGLSMPNHFSYDFQNNGSSGRALDQAEYETGAEQPPSFRRTATRADLLDGVYATCPSMSRAQAREIFEMALEEVSDALTRGESVKLRSFGLFTVRKKRERIGRNPRTGVEVPIKPRRVLTFKPSPVLLDQVNGRETHGDDHEADERGH